MWYKESQSTQGTGYSSVELIVNSICVHTLNGFMPAGFFLTKWSYFLTINSPEYSITKKLQQNETTKLIVYVLVNPPPPHKQCITFNDNRVHLISKKIGVFDRSWSWLMQSIIKLINIIYFKMIKKNNVAFLLMFTFVDSITHPFQ